MVMSTGTEPPTIDKLTVLLAYRVLPGLPEATLRRSIFSDQVVVDVSEITSIKGVNK